VHLAGDSVIETGDESGAGEDAPDITPDITFEAE